MGLWCNHLEEYLSRHGEAVGNDGLFIRGFALPAVQLQAAAPGQQTLSVHLRRRHARELASCRETETAKKNAIVGDPESGYQRVYELGSNCHLSGTCCGRT